MKKQNSHIKELMFYSIIVLVLIIFALINNFCWKFGKKEEKKVNNVETQQLEMNNITYNVPFDEQWLD